MYYPICGTIDYYTRYCVAWVDPELAHYYRSLVPKDRYIQKPMYPAHCTIVSKYDEKSEFYKQKKYQGKRLVLWYENIVQESGPYFGLTVDSRAIERMRRELGLSKLMGDKPYHITVGNNK